jgi:hypothetical protein
MRYESEYATYFKHYAVISAIDRDDLNTKHVKCIAMRLDFLCASPLQCL